MRIVTPPSMDPSFAVSPDGRHIVFPASSVGRSQLWIRTLRSEHARPLPGTDSTWFSLQPFWSPDGRSVGFFDGTSLKRIDIDFDDGATRTVATARAPRGGTWNQDGGP